MHGLATAAAAFLALAGTTVFGLDVKIDDECELSV
jgi:hypothetical protein